MTATLEFDGLSADGWRRLANARWSLCLGAGINGKLMPDWLDLTRRLVNECNGMGLGKTDFRGLVEDSRWSLDAWIQQALNVYVANGKSEDEFSEHLRDVLYSDFLELAEKSNIHSEAALLLSNPQWIRERKFDDVVSFLQKHFQDTTAYKLADLFTRLDPDKLPSAVLNFNADTFFHSIFSILRKKQHRDETGRWEDPPDTFTRIVRSSGGIVSRKIPIYHLHGCMVPKSPARRKMSDSPAAMVFPENSYTSLAGRMFSWAQSVFLYHAQADSLCFVGVSMADTNIRRWLSWTFEGYSADLSSVAARADLSGRHVWLTTRSRKSADPRSTLYPNALHHLGVQICWIPNWAHCPGAFRNILGIRS
jgi:hypothetical protein